MTARAYIDQLARSKALTYEKVTALNAAMDKKKTKELKAFAVKLDKDAATSAPEDADRMHSLAKILKK